MSQVRTEDLLKYYKWQLEKHNIKKSESKAKYEINAAAYESKFLNRIFGWKYSDSIAGIRIYEDNLFFGFKDDFYTEMIDQCNYNVKIGFQYMDLPTRSGVFYSWAAEHNIPT